MVSENNQLPPENVDGVTPVDFPVITEKTLEDMDLHETRLSTLGLEMESLCHVASLLETKPSREMLSYALEKYGLTQVISNEDENKSAQVVWDRTKMNLRRYQSELFSYAKIIQSGAESAVERLEMMYEMAGNIQADPYKESITLNKNKKYGIDGKFEPKDIRPLMDQTQNLLDFFDKVLLNYMKDVDKILLKVELDHNWSDDTLMQFDKYDAIKWMRNSVDAKDEERPNSTAHVVRSVISQGDKAIYYYDPTAVKSNKDNETTKDWRFAVNTIKRLRLKYRTIPGMKPLNEEDNVIPVGNAGSIKQRITYILGIAKRIMARGGYDKKISAELRKMEVDAEKVRNKARGLRDETTKVSGRDTNPDEENVSRPIATDIVKDLVQIMTSMTRLVTDYNNGLAGQLRLIGALGYVADLELKAFEAPMKKPTEEIVAKTKV